MTSASLIICVCLTPISVHGQEQDRLPAEFEGVWKIVTITENGVDQPLATDSSLSTGEWGMSEIVICEDRLITIDTDGSSMAGKARLLTTEPEAKIEVTTGICHDKQGDKSCAVLKLDDDKLILTWGSPEIRVVDDAAGGDQIVIVARRQ